MSQLLWTKSESREVRPFFSIEDFAQCLTRAEIRLFEGQAFSNAEAFVLAQDDIQRVRPEIRINLNLPTVDSSGLKSSDLSLLICLTGANLKKTKTLLRVPLDQNIPESIEVSDDDLRSVGGSENLIVKLGVCLNRDLKPAIGRPFLEGHWIARKNFRISVAKDVNQFEVMPRTDEEWRQHGYPEKTLYLVEYSSGMNDPVDKDSPIANVWIHADLYNRLAVEVESKKARATMSFLSAEIALQLIVQSFPEWKDAESVTPKSPLWALMKQVSLIEKIDLQKLGYMVDQPGQPRLRALIHNQQGTVRALVEA